MKNIFKAARPFLILLFITCCGCDVIYGMLHKEGAQEKKLLGNDLPLESNPKVEHIQMLLKIYGYYSGNIDGVLGFMTRHAVSRFQKNNGLNQSGFVDQGTWEKLKVFEDNGLVADGKLNIKLIQEVLQKGGFAIGKVDGVWGNKTEMAIKDFQQKSGLKPDGKVGYQTLTFLAQYLQSS